MSTSIDSFMQVIELFQNAWLAQSNLRENIQILQKGAKDGTLTVPIDKAVQDMAKAFQARITMYEAALVNNPDLLAQANKMGIDSNDFTTMKDTLKTKVDELAVTTVKDQTGLDSLVTDILSVVPKTERVFVDEVSFTTINTTK